MEEKPDLEYTGREHFDEQHVGQIIRFRVCARCYGHLTPDVDHEAPVEHRRIVRCLRCSDAWGGATVSKKYVERLQAQEKADYYEVKNNPALADILPPREKKTEAQLLKEMGF